MPPAYFYHQIPNAGPFLSGRNLGQPSIIRGACNFLDETLIALKDDFEVVLLPRGDIQKNYYMQKRFKGLIVVQESISLANIMKKCALFIGAGGTMTREAAVLGIPTISIYQDDLLDVDKYLIQKGAMAHIKELSPDFVKTFLQNWKKILRIKIC